MDHLLFWTGSRVELSIFFFFFFNLYFQILREGTDSIYMSNGGSLLFPLKSKRFLLVVLDLLENFLALSAYIKISQQIYIKI